MDGENIGNLCKALECSCREIIPAAENSYETLHQIWSEGSNESAGPDDAIQFSWSAGIGMISV